MNISPSSSPTHYAYPTSEPGSPAGELGYLVESLSLGSAPSPHSFPSVPPLAHVGLEHYSASVRGDRSETPLAQALTRELSRFDGSSNPEQIITSALGQKDANPELSSLPDDEFLALHCYTHDFYKAVNRQLRSGRPTEDMQRIVQHMDRGLKRLAENPENVVNGTLYRGINKPVTDDFIHQNFRLGGIYRDKTFISASEDRDIADADFTVLTMNRGLVQKSPILELESTSAVRISSLTRYDEEQEAIFALDTQFRVTGKEQDEAGSWRIKLKEI